MPELIASGCHIVEPRSGRTHPEDEHFLLKGREMPVSKRMLANVLLSIVRLGCAEPTRVIRGLEIGL